MSSIDLFFSRDCALGACPVVDVPSPSVLVAKSGFCEAGVAAFALSVLVPCWPSPPNVDGMEFDTGAVAPEIGGADVDVFVAAG